MQKIDPNETIFRYMRKSTTVQFQRFETETDANEPFSQRKLIRRAELRPWLLGAEVEQIVNPIAVMASERVNMKETQNWFGVRHYATKKLGIGDFFHSPFSGHVEIYRSWVIEHDYLWDEQALDGTATEVVLERLRQGTASFEEEAALFVDGQSFKRSKESANSEQRLVIRNDQGEWREPLFGEPDDRRDFCLMVMSELATRQILSLSEKPGGAIGS